MTEPLATVPESAPRRCDAVSGNLQCWALPDHSGEHYDAGRNEFFSAPRPVPETAAGCDHWTEDQKIRPGVRFMCQSHETRDGALWHVSAEQVAWKGGSKFDYPRPAPPAEPVEEQQ